MESLSLWSFSYCLARPLYDIAVFSNRLVIGKRSYYRRGGAPKGKSLLGQIGFAFFQHKKNGATFVVITDSRT